MKLVCTKDPNHKEFSVTAHIAQEWKVDANGNFLEVTEDCTDTVHKPDLMDFYTCFECGADAKVLNNEGVLIR
jgi:hypothetical protein